MSRLYTLLLAILLPASSVVSASNSYFDFDVFLDARPIGTHRFDIVRAPDGAHTVTSAAAFDVNILGFVAYSYRHQATESWARGCLVQIDASTNDDGQNLQVTGVERNGRFQLGQVRSPVYREGCVTSYAYWDPQRLLHQRELLNPQTGRFDQVRIESLGEETLAIRGKSVPADRYRLHSGKLAIDLWYSKTGQWLQLDSTTSSKRQLRYRLRGN
jgi:hypothetical protein